MTMLIKGGLIHTMTEQGSYVGDILVRDGHIEQVAPGLSVPEEQNACILDARSLFILPGMVDIHIHDGPETDVALLHSPHAAGVTCGMLWPEEEGKCSLLTASSLQEIPVYAISASDCTDAVLRERMRDLSARGCRIACEINSPEACRRILAAAQATRAKPILVHLTDCEAYLEEVAASGCPVVLGVNHQRRGNPWKMACRLEQLGVLTALTCNHPDAKLCHLPLCGALCVRAGMDRESALHMLTTAPAAIAGLSDRGAIRAGGQADLAIYDGDPLLLASSHVMTIAGGKIRH